MAKGKTGHNLDNIFDGGATNRAGDFQKAQLDGIAEAQVPRRKQNRREFHG
jgi:hypothetical protein